MTGWHMDMGSGWWVLGPIMMVVFWGGLFWLIAKMITGQPQQPKGDAGISAREIAARRYAAGEIDEVEYSRISKLLEN